MTKPPPKTATNFPLIVHNDASVAAVFRFERLEAGQRSGHGMDRSPHRHNFFELFLFESGTGYHDIDFERYPIHAGSLHWVQANQLHFLARADTCSGWVVGFSAALFADAGDGSWFAGLRLNQPGASCPAVISATAALAIDIRQQFEAIDRGQREGQGEGLQYARLRLLLTLTEAACQLTLPLPETTPSLKQTRCQLFLALVETHYLREHNIGFYADILSCSPEQLRESCRASRGKSPQGLLHERQLLEAKRLLLHTSAAVKEIAFDLGFEDPAYFGRFFRRLSGRSPEVFRLEFREKYQ